MPDPRRGGWNPTVASGSSGVSMSVRNWNLDSGFTSQDCDFKARSMEECV